MNKEQFPDIEIVARIVHDAWWKEKKAQGFHAPIDCPGEAHKKYKNAKEENKSADMNIDEKKFRWCEKCHPDMYPYEELPDDIKELDRATIRAVYRAIEQARENE
jgi:hypothetical protein